MNVTNARPRVLLVDDEQSCRVVVGRRLQALGYEALTAASGEEGLRVAEEQQPDLILLDVMMPKMKGREVCARLKVNPRTQHIPVIFLTALGLADHVKAGMDVGAEDYIVKPYKPKELKQRITVCLLRHAKSRGTSRR